MLISGDFNLRRRSSAASLDLSPPSRGDPPSPLPVDGAGESGAPREPTEASRRAVPIRGVVRGECGTDSGSGGGR